MHKHSEFFKLIHECQKQNIDLSVLLEPSIAAFRRLVLDVTRLMRSRHATLPPADQRLRQISFGVHQFPYPQTSAIQQSIRVRQAGYICTSRYIKHNQPVATAPES